MEDHGLGPMIAAAVSLLAATVIAIPLFQRLRLGSVLGYFAAGLVIGPFGLKLFHDPEQMLHVSELGVVLFLFIIGLEMRPARLWSMRGEIFGLGFAQVLACIALLTGTIIAFGYSPAVAFIAASGFVLSSTAVIMAVLQDQGQLGTPEGRRAVSILLFEDLMIVPLLAIVAFLAPVSAAHGSFWLSAATALGAAALLIAAGRWLLDPMFAMLANAGSREAMSAGALLVVLGAALLLESAGLSMAMGAFLAGVMLSQSTYRHQIEADIEPFRGMLMGLFFMAVGMSLDLSVVWSNLGLVLALLVAMMLVKALGVWAVARLTGSASRAAIRRMVLFAQGGEFAFVLYSAAQGTGLFDAGASALFSAVVILSMAITPFALLLLDRLLPAERPDLDGISAPENLRRQALVIGFGRFGQIASQGLLSQGMALTIIDTDIEMIRAAERLGFKVYYGDGTRLDILHASGAGAAEQILICVDRGEDAVKIIDLLQAEFPQARLLVRAYDRRTSLELREKAVEFEIRETFESALVMVAASLEVLGLGPAESDQIVADLRSRDRERMAAQMVEGLPGGRDLLHSNIADSMQD